jgi:hypothetical protein
MIDDDNGEIMQPTLIGRRVKKTHRLARKLIRLKDIKEDILTPESYNVYAAKADRLLFYFVNDKEAMKTLDFLHFLNPKLCTDLIDNL